MSIFSEIVFMNLSDGWADSNHKCFEGIHWAHMHVSNIPAFHCNHCRNACADTLAKARRCQLTVMGRGIMGSMGTATMVSAGEDIFKPRKPQESILSLSGVLLRVCRV